METKQPDDAQKNKSQRAASASTSKGSIFDFGPRETARENLADILKALGIVVVLVSFSIANIVVLVLAIILSFIFPSFADFILPGASLTDLPTLGQFFLSTLPLLLGTSVYAMLLFSKIIKTFGGGLVAFVVIFLLALGIGGFFGGVSLSNLYPQLPPGAAPPQNLGDIPDLVGRIINLFWTQYGPYRFFVTIIAGVVLAWALIIKTKRSVASSEKYRQGTP